MAFFDMKNGFDRQVEETGCHYAAVNKIAADAREKLQEVGHLCNISDAIRWAVTGEEPNIHVNEAAISIAKRSDIDRYMDALFDNVDDDEVKAAVEDSVRFSRYQGHLIYEYKDIQDEPRKARVRVLVRMVCSIADKVAK